MKSEFNSSSRFREKHIQTKKLALSEKLLLVVNFIIILIFFSDIFFPDLLFPQWTFSWEGIKIPIVLVANFLFVLFWLYRVRYLFLLSLASIIVCITFTVQQQGWTEMLNLTTKVLMVPDEQEAEFVKDYVGSNINLPEHPRLWLKDDDIIAIKKNISRNTDWANVNKIILDAADLAIVTKMPTHKIGSAAVALYNQAEENRRLLFLSYAGRITKDKKYIQAATEELQSVALLEGWKSNRFSNNADGVAEVTMGMSLAFDCLYNYLDPESRTLITNAIISKGINLSLDTYYNSWLGESNEKNQINNSAMICAAIAIYESNPKLAKQIINRSIASLHNSTVGLYSNKGVYFEGYQKGMMGSTYLALAIDALSFNKTLLNKEIGVLEKSTEYFEHMIGPTGLSYNYSDNMLYSNEGLDDIRLNPFLCWISNSNYNFSSQGISQFILSHGTFKEFGADNFLPITINWAAKIKNDKTFPPPANMFIERGKNAIAAMRTGWDNNAIYVGFKAGSPSNSGGHMDVGSFILDAQGKRWVTDIGGDDLPRIEGKGVNVNDMSQNSRRWDLFRNNSESHSNLTINNAYQQVSGVADITKYSDQKDFMYAVSDATPVYNSLLSSAKRGIAIINQKYVLVHDEIETLPMESIIKWKIITPASIKILAKDIAELDQNDKKIYMRVIQPANIKLEEWSTRPTYSYEAKNLNQTLLGFKLNINDRKKQQISVVFSDDYNLIQNIPKPQVLDKWGK